MTAAQDDYLHRLVDLATKTDHERICVADMLAALGSASGHLLMLLFALPNALPSLPGTSTVLGLPLLFFSTQLAIGAKPWLPRWVAARSLARSDFTAIVTRMQAFHARRLAGMHVRWPALATGAATRIASAFGVLIAIVLVLPLPLVNIPAALTLVLLSFGALRGDGRFVLAGYALGLATLLLAAAVVFGLSEAALAALRLRWT
ncbi:exopolysaccharide biosynthesis protein [Variovorax sp. J22R133]|uniref:exopolysaccharide biosynthesis protein n=1 Tax=Variovorax brevis TaxID=3053503 RepID=UPI00257713AC|nr:exopolysaccharide biosynthesis protein [Variovorax sp. J22R133]MDM0116376.1 exopolysaccharide biosynthesis protein [Variovorax sp. J22R133]